MRSIKAPIAASDAACFLSCVQQAGFTDQVSQPALGRVAGGHVGDWSCADILRIPCRNHGSGVAADQA